jgi:hypothetical protein
MKKTDPFSNHGTSRVFLSLVKGTRNPKAIADFLGIQPPPVIEQLKRLRKTKTVKLGEKEGKEQNYDIVWIEFLDFFIADAISKRQNTDDVIIHPDQEQIEQIKRLKNNIYFQRFIEEYLKNMAEGKPSTWKTVRDAINNFENALRQIPALKHSRKFEGDDPKQFYFNTMRKWRNRTLEVKTWMDICLHDAFDKTL